MKRLISMLGLTVVCAFSPLFAANVEPLKSVPYISLDKYLGKWYEIARYENSFEEGCVGATAEYWMEDEVLRIINRCFDEKGLEIDYAKGRANVVENSGNSQLRVTFFWPFYGNYWVVKLAEDYRYAIVGEPSRQYLWILARDKVLSEDDTRTILEALPHLGYDGAKLYWTKN